MMLPAPGFHHVHLNSVDPDAAHVYDHIALSVADLEEPYPLGDTRAVMIEGPSREALELVEERRT